LGPIGLTRVHSGDHKTSSFLKREKTALNRPSLRLDGDAGFQINPGHLFHINPYHNGLSSASGPGKGPQARQLGKPAAIYAIQARAPAAQSAKVAPDFYKSDNCFARSNAVRIAGVGLPSAVRKP
jgi:hypothetical protein